MVAKFFLILICSCSALIEERFSDIGDRYCTTYTPFQGSSKETALEHMHTISKAEHLPGTRWQILVSGDDQEKLIFEKITTYPLPEGDEFIALKKGKRGWHETRLTFSRPLSSQDKDIWIEFLKKGG